LKVEKQKPKALAIFGQKSHWDFIPMLEAFSDVFDFELCLLEKDVTNYLPKTNYKTYLFKESPEIPGNMPGLEYRLEETSAIFIFDHWSMSSFQGARLSSKYDIPLFSIFSGTQKKLYSNMANISAVKFDICRTVAKFYALSNHCREVLLDEGVPREKVEILPYRIDFNKQGKDRSSEFKDYLGLNRNSDVVVYEDDLNSESDAGLVLRAWRKFLAVNTLLNDPILLILGSGEYASDLKYLASDLGVAKKVAFLEQDNYEFKFDLYRICDFYIPALNFDRQLEVKYPVRALEAVSCGAHPVLSSDPLYKELLPGYEVFLRDNSEESITNGLLDAASRKLLMSNDNHSPYELVKFVNFSDWDCSEVKTQLTKIVEEYKETKPDFKAALVLIEGLVDSGNYDDAMIEIEDNLLKRYLTKFYRSDFWRLKGDCIRSFGDFDNAFKCYEESLGFNPSNSKSYLSLGKMSVTIKSYTDAANFFSKAISIDDSEGEAYVGLSLSSLNAGMVKESQYYLESAIIRDARTTSVIPVMSKLVSGSKNSKGNIAFLERVKELSDDSKQMMLALGKLHLEHGDQDLGKKYLTKAM
jgi:tetratricopeptide (TPR) repeat protein